MDLLAQSLDNIIKECKALLNDPVRAEANAMPGNTWFLPNGDVLALPRDTGDSRYPYGQDGFNFWVYASGYMHGNEGLFSNFLRASHGQEPNIGFFAGLPGEKPGVFDPVPLLSVPRFHDEGDSPNRYTVLGADAAWFITELPKLQFGLRVFVTKNRALCFSIHFTNQSESTESFFISSYFNPFLRHQIHESGEDMWFKEINILPPSAEQGELGSFVIQVHEDEDRHTTRTNYGVLRRTLTANDNCKLISHQETTSRAQYVGGARSSLHSPTALRNGSFGEPQPVCTFTETAIAGDLLHIELGAGQSGRLDLVFSCPEDLTQTEMISGQSINPEAIDSQLEVLISETAAKQAGLTVTIGGAGDDRLKPPVFNAFFEHLKKQVEFCSLIKGYIQLSQNSLIGIRDVFQAIEGQLLWQPQAARKKMLEALDYTSPDGRCFRQYSLPSAGQVGRMDLRPFIDQGVWVISTLCTYLRATGDWDILHEDCIYHKIVDEKAGQVMPSNQSDSVLQHLLKIMDFLLDHRDHSETGCVRAMYGDWNDALDGLGISHDPTQAYGNGVSVMATLQVYQNTQEMVEILTHVNKKDFTREIDRYHKAGDRIAEGLAQHAIVKDKDNTRILHGWGDQRSYLVGGFHDPDNQARDGVTSNAFWVLSGLYDKDPSIKKVITNAFERLDSKYGYKTFEPAFPANTPGVGRIPKLPPGTAENGASYIHATSFAIMALFKMGMAKEAWNQIIKILPFTDIHENLSHSPFVMPNSYGCNIDKFIDGQNMNDWQTGSSNVILKLLIRFAFGYEPMMDGVWIQPAAWAPYQSYDFRLEARGCDVHIDYQNSSGENQRQFTVNGKTQQGVHDALMGLDKLWVPYDDFKAGTLEIVVNDTA